MIIPRSKDELARLIETEPRLVLFFTADWCPDCQYIYPVMPELEAENPDMTFVRLDRDDFIDLAQDWQIFGIPSFLVMEKGQEKGRLVNRLRKTKAEISDFLASYH